MNVMLCDNSGKIYPSTNLTTNSTKKTDVLTGEPFPGRAGPAACNPCPEAAGVPALDRPRPALPPAAAAPAARRIPEGVRRGPCSHPLAGDLLGRPLSLLTDPLNTTDRIQIQL